MAKESFVIFKEFYPAIAGLSDLQLGKLFRAIFIYQREGIDCEDPEILMAFLFFKNQFRLDDIKYQKTVERNRGNGSNGGRPPKPKEPNLTQPNPENPVGFSEPKKPDNEKDKDNGKENVKEKIKPSSDKSDGLTNPFLESYNAFLKKRTGTTEQFSVAGRAGLKKIIAYLKSQVENKHKGAAPEFITEETLKAWQWVLNHFEKWDKFHQGQLKIEQINSNLVNIISSIRNAKQSKSGTKHGTDYNRVAAEAISIVAANYGLNGTPNQHTTQGEPPSNSSEGDFSDFEVMQ